jgi:thiosulfate dehydrogenase [quinone] large subunit
MAETKIEIAEPKLSRFLFADTHFSWVWLIVRLYVGWQWLEAGWGKLHNSAWVGPSAGGALRGFVNNALAKSASAHPDVQGWYAGFLRNVILPHEAVMAHMVAFGETLVGIALILGLFTGIAAFFGTFMNLNYLLAGTVSLNPILFLLQLFLILAWRTAGWIGLDRYLLKVFGTPWQPGSLFKK